METRPEMDELLRTLQETDNGWDDVIVATAAAMAGENLELTLELRPAPVQRWKVVCREVLDHIICLDQAECDLQVHTDHVLLWQYQKPVVALYFHLARPNPHAVIGALYMKHRELVGEWYSFGRWLNGEHNLKRLVGDGYGLLAEGPEPLILAYDEIMKDAGFQTSLLSRPPKHWKNDRWLNTDGPLVALTLGSMYVIAKEAHATRIT